MIVLQWHNILIINVFLSLTSSSGSLLLELLVLLLRAACHRFPAIGVLGEDCTREWALKDF